MTTRRALLQGLGAISAALPLAELTPALAQGYVGAQRGQGDLVFIPGKDVEAVAMAEWEAEAAGADGGAAPLRVASGEAAKKAPATASRYTAKTYNFPSGAYRVLHWKKGDGPVIHQIGFETEIFVAQGSVTLAPLFAVAGPKATLKAGDALFMGNGMLRNLKPGEDTVLITALVSGTSKAPKSAIVRAKDAKPSDGAQGTARWSINRYDFDGNSLRLVNFKKGGRLDTGVTARADVLIYVTKGRLRRTEGSATAELRAGDALRERLGNGGAWELLEDSQLLATDAPVNPQMFAPGMSG